METPQNGHLESNMIFLGVHQDLDFQKRAGNQDLRLRHLTKAGPLEVCGEKLEYLFTLV